MLDAKKNKGRLQPYLANPNVRWLDVDVTNVKLMPFEEHEGDRYGLRAGDVVICEGGEAGRAAIWDGRIPEMKFQKAIHRVRPRENLDARFLVHRLMADAQSGRLADYYTGATIKHLTGQDLARYRLPLPAIAEQRRIAAILDKADSLIAKRQEGLEQLDGLRRAIFIDMFGDPATNPKGWPILPLGTQIRSVRYGTGSPPPYVEEGVPFIRATNIKAGRIVTWEMRHVSEEEARRLEKCQVRYGNMLVVRSGVNTGDCAAIPQELDGACAAFDLIVDTDIQNSTFFSFLINSEYGKRVLEPLTRRAAQPHLNAEQLQKLMLIAPPLKLRKVFFERVTAIEALRATHNASLGICRDLFNSLQHRAFQGVL